jgi:hypothetical protein
MFYFILFYSIASYPIPSYPIPSYPIPSYPILYYAIPSNHLYINVLYSLLGADKDFKKRSDEVLEGLTEMVGRATDIQVNLIKSI